VESAITRVREWEKRPRSIGCCFGKVEPRGAKRTPTFSPALPLPALWCGKRCSADLTGVRRGRAYSEPELRRLPTAKLPR
jgi:hypothetical protein